MGVIKDGFNDFKAWYQSKTIIAVVLGVVSTVLGLFGIDIGDVVNVTFTEAEAAADQVDAIWISVQNLVLFAVAAWGRIKAQVQIR